ncbi:transglutaminase family protein [Xanthomonas hyacinthi]|uniref:transglutaminase family protein n=1 Tax=Xanthomonas hyacinthi TaxID=56455 RepID=UPI00069FB346
MVDRLIDPATDTAAIRRELDRWERVIRANVPVGANGRLTLDALLKTLYQPGSWNEGKPFRYDLDDPLGKLPANKRLATYLATRKGNCVSMPILVAILGQRLGLTITLSTAPAHVMAMFADDTQQAWVYVEATGGGYKRDESYIRDTGISQTALDNEIYLRPLHPHESVGVIASTLMEHYAREGHGDALMEVADLALAANLKDTVAMIWKANAYYLQIQDRDQRPYPDAADIPANKVPDYRRLSRENLAWFEKAEALGWAQKTPEQEAAYLQSVRHEKANRGQ